MTGIYLNDWQDKAAMAADFDVEQSEIEHVDVLLASYGYENYSGDAFVLFRDTRDGKLYELYGSHCSCYGLEGQWAPEECDLAALKHRLTEGSLGNDKWSGNMFSVELAQVLEGLK
jgi:hypothetical protein